MFIHSLHSKGAVQFSSLVVFRRETKKKTKNDLADGLAFASQFKCCARRLYGRDVTLDKRAGGNKRRRAADLFTELIP